MKRLSFSDPKDVLALLVRRKWWAIFSFLLLFPAVLVIAWLLPGIYVSETLILIEPRDVPTEFVKDLISVTTEDRLTAIQETVLSRTNLLKVAYEFPQLRAPEVDDQTLVEGIRRDITIEFQERRGAKGPVYFSIAYQNRDAALAQRVANRLAVLFIEHDSRNREDQVFGTAEFLNGELQKVSAQLAETEKTLRLQKEQHGFELPGQLEANLRTLDRLQEQARANTEALDRYNALRLSLDRELLVTPPTVTKESKVGADPRRPADPLVDTYRRKKLELDQLTIKYTDKHPDVSRLKEEVAQLEKQLPPDALTEPAPQSPTVVTESNPVYLKLTGQLNEVRTEIALREKDRVWIQNEIRKVGGRIQNTPQREQEISSAQRENDELSKQYEDLKRKLTDAQLAESLESKQKGSQFVILDPANLPTFPAKPDRLLIAVLGFFGSMAFGVLLAIAVDIIDQKVWTYAELERCFGLPVLAEIPVIPSAREQKKLVQKKRFEVAFACGLLFIMLIALGTLYFSPRVQADITRQLDRITTLVKR